MNNSQIVQKPFPVGIIVGVLIGIVILSLIIYFTVTQTSSSSPSPAPVAVTGPSVTPRSAPVTTSPGPAPVTTSPGPAPVTTSPGPAPVTTSPGPAPVTTPTCPSGFVQGITGGRNWLGMAYLPSDYCYTLQSTNIPCPIGSEGADISNPPMRVCGVAPGTTLPSYNPANCNTSRTCIAGSLCINDTDCVSGACINNRCVENFWNPPGCNVSSTCPIDSNCKNDNNCSTGYCSSSKKCAQMPLYSRTQVWRGGNPGSYTWTVPPGVTKVKVLVVGRGGMSTCVFPCMTRTTKGLPGSYIYQDYNVTPGQVINVSVAESPDDILYDIRAGRGNGGLGLVSKFGTLQAVNGQDDVPLSTVASPAVTLTIPDGTMNVLGSTNTITIRGGTIKIGGEFTSLSANEVVYGRGDHPSYDADSTHQLVRRETLAIVQVWWPA